MTRIPTGTDFCAIRSQADHIAGAAAAAYWLECSDASSHNVTFQLDEIVRETRKIAALLGMRLIEDVPAAPLDRVMTQSASAMIPEDML